MIGTLGDPPGQVLSAKIQEKNLLPPTFGYFFPIIGFRCHIPGFVAPRHFEVLVASLNELFWMVFRKVCDSIVSRYDYIKFVNNESQLIMVGQKPSTTGALGSKKQAWRDDLTRFLGNGMPSKSFTITKSLNAKCHVRMLSPHLNNDMIIGVTIPPFPNSFILNWCLSSPFDPPSELLLGAVTTEIFPILRRNGGLMMIGKWQMTIIHVSKFMEA